MIIRPEKKGDESSIFNVNISAFETDEEAKLVNKLRGKVKTYISLVAENKDIIIGHVMFTPVYLSDNSKLKLMGLAPMAVLPEYQGQGIGSSLIYAGLEQCKEMGITAVVVLGHPTYYPRFGFTQASRFNLKCEYDVPDEVFMVIELKPGSLNNIQGIIKYHDAFGEI